MVGADETIATRMVVRDGKYTGDVAFYAYGENKAIGIRALAQQHGWNLDDCYAYSDSATDLPMLEAVGHPVAVNPDRALRKVASERGWPVRAFRRPVSLRSRIAQLRRPHPVASAAIGAGAVAVAIYARRR